MIGNEQKATSHGRTMSGLLSAGRQHKSILIQIQKNLSLFTVAWKNIHTEFGCYIRSHSHRRALLAATHYYCANKLFAILPLNSNIEQEIRQNTGDI